MNVTLRSAVTHLSVIGTKGVKDRPNEVSKNGPYLLTDVEGVEDVAGPLCVVASTPDVDDVLHQHGRVPVAHVGHLSGALPAPRAHWRQFRPSQRHCRGGTGGRYTRKRKYYQQELQW